MAKTFSFSVLALAAILFAAGAGAAELYGRLSSGDRRLVENATIEVVCGDWNTSRAPTRIGSDGKYTVRGIPGGRGCYFVINSGSYRASSRVNFSTNKSVVRIDGDLRVRDNQILVLRH